MTSLLRTQMTRSPIDLFFALLGDAPDIALLSDDACWNTIQTHSRTYGVAPLLASLARSHVDAQRRKWCDDVLVESWRRHDRMFRQLEFLTSTLASAGIETIALKGPLLARRYYEPPFLRKPSLDLDLAVRADDLEKAYAALYAIGYRASASVGYVTGHSHHLEMSHPERPHVELHIRLTHRSLGLAVEPFFERAISFEFPSGVRTLVLSPADQLLHLALHLAQSRFGTVFHLYELRKIWKSQPAAVTREATERGVECHYRGVLRMLDIAVKERFGEPLLPCDVEVPSTWLNKRLTTEMYKRFESWAVPGRGLSVGQRIWARWMDFQLTDTPADARRSLAFFLRTAVYHVGDLNAWRLVKPLRFAPPAPKQSR